jgi:hypothetical protein
MKEKQRLTVFDAEARLVEEQALHGCATGLRPPAHAHD